MRDIEAVGWQVRALLLRLHIEYDGIFVQDGSVLIEIRLDEIGD